MQDQDEVKHRKQLAQIMRYIASMHTTLYDQSNLGFCQNVTRPEVAVDFFANEDEVLFTTDSFRHLLSLQQERDVFERPPFTFYAAAADSRPKKRSLQSLFQGGPEKTCWLRITRLTASQITRCPTMPDRVRPYFDAWVTSSGQRLASLLKLESLEAAPKVAPGARHATQIHQFLRRRKKHLRQKTFLDLVEPIYNRLFEWQQQDQAELVWGLGHARMLLEDGTLVNGPLLEVLLEVELARDGALVLRPREHTGVTLNRNVVAGLGANGALVSQLYKDVAELEPAHLSPAQPTTYAKLLQRMAVELSPGGIYRNSSNSQVQNPGRLVVTEAWCVYQRSKPSSVWARDATAFADQLSLGNTKALPLASWAFTAGPSVLDELMESHNSKNSVWRQLQQFIPSLSTKASKANPEERPLFPLPTSAAQNRIANLLFNGHPAVVCEGPPGTGKSHSIANLICAYLCKGKRVLCTSKQAPALAVLRERLPPSVRELCVDVSRSELAGLQQLQLTVERLANRVASASTVLETEKCDFLQKAISQHERELNQIDSKLTKQSDRIRKLVQEPRGQEYLERALTFVEETPWLAAKLAEWSVREVSRFSERIKALILDPGDDIHKVTGFPVPPSDALISRVAAEAGNVFSVVKNAVESGAASMPLIGSITGITDRRDAIEQSLSQIRFDNGRPDSPVEWKKVLYALQHSKALHKFELECWRVHEGKDGWPRYRFAEVTEKLIEVNEIFSRAVQLKTTARTLRVESEIQKALDCRKLDVRRNMIATRLQGLAEELVDATVLTELSRSFSTTAQSALIRFAQIAGKAKFSRASSSSKMTQRQRRRRQEYLDAFDKCCRFIPCWILTTSQISDYLPSECLFDLVILDEASQSDVTVLPGMLRGRQWLIVGDGKQVSPTESFVSEETIDCLRTALPSSPLEDSLLPGHSFFDLCGQAFPKGRVVLSEHFRCAEEIIRFSNEQFYDRRLVPLRLPTKSQRLSPSLVDVRVPDGAKVGKTNEKEADEIVRLIQDFTLSPSQTTSPRSIGVISLVGDEQSRLIRGRLLDVLGPHLMARHSVLVGDPPSFQGAERDVVYLSMVCSRGSVPTQNQLMHFQRANVAMSRARDRCVLVRSIDIHEIPNDTDSKLPIIEFFMSATAGGGWDDMEDDASGVTNRDIQQKTRTLLSNLLSSRGFTVRDMGVVWKGGLSIEQGDSDKRAALFIDCCGESNHEWQSGFNQQKAIERVGWNCMRVDAFSLLYNHKACFRNIKKFLGGLGIVEPILRDGEADVIEDEDMDVVEGEASDDHSESEEVEDNVGSDSGDHAVSVSSEDDISGAFSNSAKTTPKVVVSEQVDTNIAVDPSNFGQIVDLSFLGGASKENPKGQGPSNAESDDSETRPARGNRSRQRERPESLSNSDGDYQDDASDSSLNARASKRRRYKRLDKYSRDGRWVPGHNKEPQASDDEDWPGKDETQTTSDPVDDEENEFES